MSLVSRHDLGLFARSMASRFGRAEAAFRHGALGGPPLVRLLLVSDGLAYTSEQQFAPIRRHAGALRRQFGVVAEQVSLAAGLKLGRAALAKSQVIGLKLSFMTPAAEASRIARHFRQQIAGTATRLVYFDGEDDVCIQWPDVLSEVDLYVKKHVFADLAGYERRYVGKSNLTDYVAREHGRSFDDNVIPAAGPAPREMLSKLHLGWNIALDDKIEALTRSLPAVDPSAKDVDVGSRAFVKEDVWIHPLRAPLVEGIGAMEGRYRVLAPRERVSQEQYYAEMLRARICVSPFGYGELCWRDFEAILCGCLLVKPDMGHVRTYPDVFKPGETYAPVKWDYSNLADVCAAYLEDEATRLRVASRAREVVTEALGEPAFLRTFDALMARLGIEVRRAPLAA